MRPSPRIIVLTLCLLIAAAFAAAAGWTVWRRQAAPPPAPASPGLGIGGPFALVDTEGRPVTDRSLIGKPTAIFFGFTYCPEVCPTTLAELTAAARELGPDADRLNLVFVTIDPERDTAAQLKTYLSSFDPRIRGLTGSPDAIAQAAKAYRIYYRKVPTSNGGYTLDHSASILLFDKAGGFVEPIAYGAPLDRMVGQLKGLLAG